MPVNPLSRHRAIVDADGKPTQLMQLFSEEITRLAPSDSPTITTSITFAGYGVRIYGDFSNANASDRVLFQTSTANSATRIDAVPSGTSTTATIGALNSSAANNCAWARLSITSSEARVESLILGAASYLPLNLHTSGVPRLQIDTSGNCKPLADNAYTCGASGLRFSEFWGANGTIQTSDVRTKTNIEESVLGLDFINYLEPISYKFIVGGNDVAPGASEADEPIVTPRPGVRTHWGFSAQHVKQIADIFGVDFGGHILSDINDPESQQGLRMDQFIAPLVKAIQEQSVIIDQLNARIEALENE